MRRHGLIAVLSVVFTACVLLPPRSTAAPGSQWRHAWGLLKAPPAAATPASDRSSTAMARLQLRGTAPHYQAWVENLLAGPVQVTLRPRDGAVLSSTPALPATAVLPSDSRQLLAQLHPGRSGLPGGIDLVLDVVPGDPAARPDDHAYLLPFEADRIRIDQGFGGRFSHDDPQNRYALDFALPEGTPVLAACSGRVMQLRDGNDGEANFIRLLHADGSMSLYAHLQAGGVLVRVGQQVQAGQRIGLSGNTGNSSAPHLHFARQRNLGMRLESIRFRMSSPRGELHFPAIEAGPAPDAGG